MGNILDRVDSPDDVKNLGDEEIEELCSELRETIIETVSNNGGHLASNLGVVELTVALMRAFNPPKDSIIWDVGHQSYAYKLLTGRYKRFSTIRQENGISGFPSREESPCDVFTTGHSSTSISSALGLSEADSLLGKEGSIVAVIGDGALPGGLAYEGLNNAGRLHRNFIVILNDNNMSISRNVGSIARYLTYIRTKQGYIKAKFNIENTLRKLLLIGAPIASLLYRLKARIKKIFYNTTIFEDLGFIYYGPFDGHNVKELTNVLNTVKLIKRPVLLHVRTYKGKGYSYAENDPTIYHGLSSFDISTGETGSSSPGFSDVFGETMCTLGAEEPRLCAITAAMLTGTGLTRFKELYKNRFYDVGISEEHAVTFAAGLSAGGMLPVFAVYSTFLQRSYDQLVHDAAIQKLKIILAIDRAGIVGEDGLTHQGIYDAAYLSTIPGVTLYSPSYYDELRIQLTYLVENGTGLCAVRYPRGKELYKPEYVQDSAEPFKIYGDENAAICIVSYGRIFSFAAEAMERLAKRDLPVKLIKLNRIIPIDYEAAESAAKCARVYFFEEGIANGGIGERFCLILSERGFNGAYKLHAINDPFIFQAPMFRSLEKLGLSVSGIENAVLSDSFPERNTELEKET